MFFFVGVAIKIALLVSWRTTPGCPCSNLMIRSLKFKKDVYLKNVALDFVLLVLKFITHPSYYLTFIMDKTQHGPVIALFSGQLQEHF